jgi:hypothetical protein
LFKIAADFSKNEEIVRLHQREVGKKTIYHNQLKRIVDLMKVDQNEDWCGQLIDVSRIMAETVEEQQQIQAKFGPLLDDGFGDEEIVQLENEALFQAL